MASGRASAHEFKLLAGYTHWPAGDLQREIARGHWWLVAASSDFVLSSVQGMPMHCSIMLFGEAENNDKDAVCPAGML